jgi:hypothetical protein
MIRLTFVEFLFRAIPESFLIVMIAYIFCNKNIAKVLIIKATLIFSISVYLIRLLPIALGVHTIIASICFVIISVFILKISINVSIFSILVSVISLSTCELINSFLLVIIFKIKVFPSIKLRLIYNTPSLIMFMFIVLIIYVFVDKTNFSLKDSENLL